MRQTDMSDSILNNTISLHKPSIVIDDTDPAVQYTGPWLAISQSGIAGASTTGSPLFSTLHSLSNFNGTISYTFSGIGISVFITTMGEYRNYTSQCFLDGVPVPTAAEGKDQQSNTQLCGGFALLDTVPHNLLVTISMQIDQKGGAPGSSGFFFDYILVEPSPTMSLEGKSLMLSFNIPALVTIYASNAMGEWEIRCDGLQNAYAAGNWTYVQGNNPINGLLSSKSGSQLTFSFTGSAVWWYGYSTTTMPPDNSNGATYAVDGGDFAQIQISGDNADNLTQQTVFNTPSVQYGNHSIQVVNHGSSEETPLTLQYMVLQVEPVPSASLSSKLPTTTTPFTSPSAISASFKSHAGAISGGVVGSLAVLLIFIAAILALNRRRIFAKQKFAKESAAEHLDPDPFRVDYTVVTARKARNSQENVANPFMQEMEAPPLTKWTRPLTRPSGARPASGLALTSSRAEVTEHTTAQLPSGPDQPVGMFEPSVTTAADGPILLENLPKATVREEDSGIRLAGADQRSIDTVVQFLPPAYTAH